MAIFFLIILCLAGTGFTLALFSGWMIFTIFRLVASGVESVIHPRKGGATIAQPSAPAWVCQRAMCRSTNPNHARFCRRCGRAVVVEPVAARMALATL